MCRTGQRGRMEEVVPKKEKVWAKVQRPQSAEDMCKWRMQEKEEGRRDGREHWYHSHGRTSRSGTGSWLSPQPGRVGVSPGSQRWRDSWLWKKGDRCSPGRTSFSQEEPSLSMLANGGDAASGDGEGVETEEQGSDCSLVPKILPFQPISISTLQRNVPSAPSCWNWRGAKGGSKTPTMIWEMVWWGQL